MEHPLIKGISGIVLACGHVGAWGARLPDTQFFETSRTLPDPAGHPFRLDTAE